MLNDKQKLLLKNLAIFLGFCLLNIGILTGSIFSSKGFWYKGLQKSVQKTLNEYSPNTYRTKEFIKLQSGISLNCASYECLNLRTNQDCVAVILRIPSITGAAPAVFIYNHDGSVLFAGYAVKNGRAQNLMNPKFASGNIEYWIKKLPEILTKAGVEK